MSSDDERGKTVAVIGGGPAGLFAAERLAGAGFSVTVYDRMPSVGRKFLLAGRGGLNLTHSEALDAFMARYGAADARLTRVIHDFPPDALRDWADGLGQPTFVGSSGRVFPKAFKTSPLLRAWLQRLAGLNVTFALRRHWQGWDAEGGLRFEQGGSLVTATPDATILALGGASWPKLGSDGAWVEALTSQGVAVAPLRGANCGFTLAWTDHFRRHEGEPLKRIAVTIGNRTERGEALITRDGIEGGVIYALSRPIREAIDRDGHADITIDLRPDGDVRELWQRLATVDRKQSLANSLRKAAKLSPVAIALMHEAPVSREKPVARLNVDELIALIKGVPLRLTGVPPITRAISTAGGVRFDALDDALMLRAKPGTFVAGEMLDWEAPTGGYLLQASFATGAAAAQGAAAWLRAHKPQNGLTGK